MSAESGEKADSSAADAERVEAFEWLVSMTMHHQAAGDEEITALWRSITTDAVMPSTLDARMAWVSRAEAAYQRSVLMSEMEAAYTVLAKDTTNVANARAFLDLAGKYRHHTDAQLVLAAVRGYATAMRSVRELGRQNLLRVLAEDERSQAHAQEGVASRFAVVLDAAVTLDLLPPPSPDEPTLTGPERHIRVLDALDT